MSNVFHFFKDGRYLLKFTEDTSFARELQIETSWAFKICINTVVKERQFLQHYII